MWTPEFLGFLRFGLLLNIAVGFLDNLKGMAHPVRGELIELEPATEAIRDDYLGIGPPYFSDQPAGNLNGQRMEVVFEAHNTGISTTV